MLKHDAGSKSESIFAEFCFTIICNSEKTVPEQKFMFLDTGFCSHVFSCQ